jgi:hypothetical protein
MMLNHGKVDLVGDYRNLINSIREFSETEQTVKKWFRNVPVSYWPMELRELSDDERLPYVKNTEYLLLGWLSAIYDASDVAIKYLAFKSEVDVAISKTAKAEHYSQSLNLLMRKIPEWLGPIATILNRGQDWRCWSNVPEPAWLKSEWWEVTRERILNDIRGKDVSNNEQLKDFFAYLQGGLQPLKKQIADFLDNASFHDDVKRDLALLETPEIHTQNPQNKDGLSEDKRTLVWGRKTKTLTTNGSRLVERLFNAYPKPLHESYLKAECDFESDIRNVVRDGKLDDVIVRAVDENGKPIRGMWQLSHLE